VETLRLAGDTLELLDQRRLPGAVAWVRCTRAADTAAAIRAMVVRGAPAIGVTAAYGIALEAQALAAGAAALEPVKAADAVGAGARLPHEVSTCGSGVPAATGADGADGAAAAFADALEAGFAALAASRPTAVNLFWALDRMRRAWRDAGAAAPAALAEQLLAAAKAIHADDVAANRALGAHGAALLQDGARVLTHCNAGALATAGHGTALGVVRSAVAAGKRISVIADETRPFLQGARLTAWELQAEGIPVTLITDNMSGHLMAQGEIDAVVVGTDRVAANGDVANKIGTYMVAVLARHHGIPFYVACPLSTIDPAVADGSAIPIEERAPEEVTGYGSEQWAPAGVAARHPAFDITPAALVTALVTEAGVVMQPDAAKIAALLARPL
jgi:methylthioribose-1-phosphate isomerase